jgi:hypothetical protein
MTLYTGQVDRDGKGFRSNRVGKRIDNIPDTGTLTGHFKVDYYGCWWEYKLDKNNSIRWIVGGYPFDKEKLSYTRGV